MRCASVLTRASDSAPCCSAQRAASLAIVVVLPAPVGPTIATTPPSLQVGSAANGRCLASRAAGMLTGSRRRVFAGYAGWSEGQLDAELEQGDWIAHAAIPEDVFTDAPEELWSSVLTRKGGKYALLARMPPDPSVN